MKEHFYDLAIKIILKFKKENSRSRIGFAVDTKPKNIRLIELHI